MKALLVSALSLVSAAAVIVVAPSPALSYHDGAPPSFDGFQSDCSACHFSFPANSGTGSITIEAPMTYADGEAVPITVTVDNTTEPDPNGVGLRTGFIVGVRDSNGDPVGSFDLGGATTMRLANNGQDDWVTHTVAGLAQDEWTFSWVPPTGGLPPTVTIYAAANAANGNESVSGDYVYTAQRDLALASTAEAMPEDDGLRLGRVWPNPVRENGQVIVTLARPALVSARLMDMRGRTVRQLAVRSLPAGESTLDVDVAGVSPGTYFLAVDVPEGRRTARVIVAR
ncbi:MAG: choice-of-anchor V domain-containing protein [Bacteroidota bacterium]